MCSQPSFLALVNKSEAAARDGKTDSSVPLQVWVSKTCCGQLPWFSATWMMTARERARRPVASKLRPSRQVSWQELQDDHTVKWQSPCREKKNNNAESKDEETKQKQRRLERASPFSLHVILPCLPFPQHFCWHCCTSSHHHHHHHHPPAHIQKEDTVNNLSLHQRPITHQVHKHTTPKAQWVVMSSIKTAT